MKQSTMTKALAAALGLAILLPVTALAASSSTHRAAATNVVRTYGKITSVDIGNFMLKVGKKTYTVTEGTQTVYVNRKGHKVAASDLVTGNWASVWGVNNKKTLAISDVTKVKDWSLK